MHNISRDLKDYLRHFFQLFPGFSSLSAWEITGKTHEIVTFAIADLNSTFIVRDGIAIHRSATIESNVTLKPPAIISQGCFIGAGAYVRGGVFLDEDVSIGPGCEIKSSIILAHSAMAHFNFVGDSLLGSNTNMEAGAVIANHYNERADKLIYAKFGNDIISTGVFKFGALVGDNSRIGANAVLSPGTILPPGSIVGRLELVDQCR